MKIALEISSAITAFLAAIFWFKSALGKVSPPEVLASGIPQNDPFIVAFREAMKLNRWAAGFAGVSALCAAFVALIDAMCG